MLETAAKPFSHRGVVALRTVLLVLWGAMLTAVLAAGALRKVGHHEQTAAQARVARGKYLVTIAGCNDCHTPLKMGPRGPEPDMSRLLSGHPEAMVMPPAPALAPEAPWNWTGAPTLTAFAGPWGTSYSANLTPDPNTGIGIWTEEMFIKALRSGKHMGQSRPIQPPMPWMSAGQMTDEDLKAVYAYLRTVPPINNRVPDAVIAPPPATAAPAPASGH